ncbi:MAG TPA: hypothetical protein VF615_00530 [Longimicrobiaceae bacterium]|jgi:hypothetical protein
MLEIIGLAITGASTAAGFYQARSFVRRKLRFVSAAQGAGAPVIAGVAATAVAVPVVALLPLVGAFTAVLFGGGVGAGVAAGARHIRQGRLPSA